MSDNLKDTRTWRELLNEIPYIKWRSVARYPEAHTNYLIFDIINKSLPVRRNNLEFKKVLPPDPRLPLDKGKTICIAVNLHPRPLEISFSTRSVKLSLDYRIDDALKVITEFDDALGEIEELYQQTVEKFSENKVDTDISEQIFQQKMTNVDVTQFGIVVENVSISDFYRPPKSESITDNQPPIVATQRFTELETGFNLEQEKLQTQDIKKLITDKEQVLNAKEQEQKQEQRIAEQDKELKAKTQRLAEQEIALKELKAKEQKLQQKAQRLAEQEKRLKAEAQRLTEQDNALKTKVQALEAKEQELQQQAQSLAELDTRLKADKQRLAELEPSLKAEKQRSDEGKEALNAKEPQIPLLDRQYIVAKKDIVPLDREVDPHDYPPIWEEEDYYDDDELVDDVPPPKKGNAILSAIIITVIIVAIGVSLFYFYDEIYEFLSEFFNKLFYFFNN